MNKLLQEIDELLTVFDLHDHCFRTANPFPSCLARIQVPPNRNQRDAGLGIPQQHASGTVRQQCVNGEGDMEDPYLLHGKAPIQVTSAPKRPEQATRERLASPCSIWSSVKEALVGVE